MENSENKPRTCENCLRLVWEIAWAAVDGKLGLRSIVEHDIRSDSELNPFTINPQRFLQQYAWSVFGVQVSVSKVLEPRWDKIKDAFGDFYPEYVASKQQTILSQVTDPPLRLRRSRDKANSVIAMACEICNRGWDYVRSKLLQGYSRDQDSNLVPSPAALKYLDQFHFVGPAVANFILKNIGFNVAKDDLVLRQYARQFGYHETPEGVHEMCSDIARLNKTTIHAVDTVLWNAKAKGNQDKLHFDCPLCNLHFDLRKK